MASSGTLSYKGYWVKVGYEDGEPVYVDSNVWFDRPVDIPYCFPYYKRRISLPRIPHSVTAEFITEVVTDCLCGQAYVGFSKTRSGSTSLTVMYGYEKQKYYVERPEDEAIILRDIKLLLMGSVE